MTECILIFDCDISEDQLSEALSDVSGGVYPIFQNSYQIAADAPYSAIRHALRTAFPEAAFALAKVKNGQTVIVYPTSAPAGACD